ncbi:MAG: hypothetical protein M3O30_14455 [Planctomycetota bacterium]|nr:hypothetical protein [Planctomycetota bacterium]
MLFEKASEEGVVEAEWPREVSLVLSALEAAGTNVEQRGVRRTPYRAKALLRLFADTHGCDEMLLYTRDANQRGIGFITTHRLPLGYGGTVEVPSPSGEKLTVHCTLLRCRQAAPGWYEGALYFNRDRSEFQVLGSRTTEPSSC